jgi:hypothetical protein
LSVPRIESYHFGEIVIDGQKYSSDVIIYPDRIVDQWWRRKGHLLQLSDLGKILEHPPDVLVIGQGSVSRMDVRAETQTALQQAGIEVIVQSTTQACKTYNSLCGKRQVVAALHLTC